MTVVDVVGAGALILAIVWLFVLMGFTAWLMWITWQDLHR